MKAHWSFHIRESIFGGDLNQFRFNLMIFLLVLLKFQRSIYDHERGINLINQKALCARFYI